MSSISEQFQVILEHMSRQALLNFEDVRPLTIEEFYNYKELYKAQLIK